MKELFDKRWPDQGKIKLDGEEEDDKKQAWSSLKTYFLENPIKSDERPEAVEVAVEADLSSYGVHQLISIIDLVRAGGRIVDFKTCGQTPTQAKAAHQHEVQTSAYALLYRDSTGQKKGGTELHTKFRIRSKHFAKRVADEKKEVLLLFFNRGIGKHARYAFPRESEGPDECLWRLVISATVHRC